MHNRRSDERNDVKELVEFTFSLNNKIREAVILDMSRNGARIMYVGNPVREENPTFGLDVDKLDIHRQSEIAWFKSLMSGVTIAGLRYL
ncbi:MAG: hypothetical protein ACE5EN_11675 [Nitrospinota bacterium]